MIRNAKLWCDVESAKEAETLSKKWDYNLVPGFTASKILWLKEHEPENFDKLAKVLLPHDYINWYLTGRYAAEVSTKTAPAGLAPVQPTAIGTRLRCHCIYTMMHWHSKSESHGIEPNSLSYMMHTDVAACLLTAWSC